MRYQTDNHGFTLIEVMISLVIMFMVLTVAFAGFRIGLNAWERGGKAIDRLDRRDNVERLMRRQLAVAYPRELVIDKKTFVMFQGTDHHLEFVADYSLPDGSGDFRKIDYVAQDGRFLYGEESLAGFIASTTQALPELPVTSIATLGNVTFEYLGADAKGKPVWFNEWKLSGDALPTAVRVRMDNDSIVVPMVNR